MSIQLFNELDYSDAFTRLIECCNCAPWAEKVLEERPFESLDSLRIRAREIWFALETENWISTFNEKPRIGDLKKLREKFADSNDRGWDQQEQSGVDGVPDETLQAIITGNEEYETKFGFRFIIFATGKSAQEMLTAIQTRLNNTREVELQAAAEENHKITGLRLFQKWLQVN